MQPNISRRWFIKAAAMLGITGAGGINMSTGGELLDDPITVRLADFLKDAKSANVIGQPYLDAVPGENDPDIIVRSIEMNHPVITSKLRTASTSETKALIAKMVTEDFSTGETIQLHGWILSRTEARLCALTSLLVNKL